MRVEWYGQSAFHLSSGSASVAIDPFGDMSALASARGMQFDYPLIAGVEAQLRRALDGGGLRHRSAAGQGWGGRGGPGGAVVGLGEGSTAMSLAHRPGA